MRCTFPLALTFLTVIPWPRLGEVSREDLARSLFWFPWVGLILGLAHLAAGLGLLWLLPAPAAAALLLAFTVFLTRGLHLDGLADTLDGLGGGQTPEARLAIMKDSRLGAFGGLGLGLVLLLKFSFLWMILEQGLWRGLVLTPLTSRWGLVFLAYLCPYARREGGLGQAVTEGATAALTAKATVPALLLALLVGGWPGPALLALIALAVWGLSAYFHEKLGGVTGDAYGAAHEVLELLSLTLVLIFPAKAGGLPFLWLFR